MSEIDNEATALTATESERRAPPPRVDEPLRLVHHHPGYLRVQAEALARAEADCPSALAARRAAEAVAGFRSWSHNAKTGSVVIEYDPHQVDPDELLQHVARKGGFRGLENATRGRRNRHDLVKTVLDTVQSVNQVVGELTGERGDLREVVPVALLATSVVSFVLNEKRGRLPQWESALYHSYRVFMHWHRDEVRDREHLATLAEARGKTGHGQ